MKDSSSTASRSRVESYLPEPGSKEVRVGRTIKKSRPGAKRHVVQSIFHDAPISFESSCEAWLFKFLELLPNVLYIEAQPSVTIFGNYPGALLSNYTPDFLVKFTDDKQVYVECKPTDWEENFFLVQKFRALDLEFMEAGFDFEVIHCPPIGSNNIFAQNVETLHGGIRKIQQTRLFNALSIYLLDRKESISVQRAIEMLVDKIDINDIFDFIRRHQWEDIKCELVDARFGLRPIGCRPDEDDEEDSHD